MTETPRSISVTGTGSAEAVPDLLTLSIGVECRRDTVAEAYGEAGTRSAAITAELRQHGVAGADISTSGLNVRAELNWQEGRGQIVTGYLASNTSPSGSARCPRPHRSLPPPLLPAATTSG